jgi:hypothetical protein
MLRYNQNYRSNFGISFEMSHHSFSSMPNFVLYFLTFKFLNSEARETRDPKFQLHITFGNSVSWQEIILACHPQLSGWKLDLALIYEEINVLSNINNRNNNNVILMIMIINAHSHFTLLH